MQKATASPLSRPQAHRHFSFFLSYFFLCLYLQKEKAGLRLMPCKTAVSQEKTSRKVTYDGEMYLLHTYRFINTQGGAPLFFLKPEAQKEKFPKEKCRKKSFAHCGERQGLRSLEPRPLPWGACMLQCEHTSKQ